MEPQLIARREIPADQVDRHGVVAEVQLPAQGVGNQYQSDYNRSGHYQNKESNFDRYDNARGIQEAATDRNVVDTSNESHFESRGGAARGAQVRIKKRNGLNCCGGCRGGRNKKHIREDSY